MRVFALSFLVALALFASCSKQVTIVSLPETSPLAQASSYGIIVDAYVSVRESPDPSLAEGFLLRKGQVVEILGARQVRGEVDEEPLAWMQIKADGRSGWVLAKTLRVYEGIEQAKKAASELAK